MKYFTVGYWLLGARRDVPFASQIAKKRLAFELSHLLRTAQEAFDPPDGSVFGVP